MDTEQAGGGPRGGRVWITKEMEPLRRIARGGEGPGVVVGGLLSQEPRVGPVWVGQT